MTDTFILMAEITGVHGIKGDVKLRLYGTNHRLLTDNVLCDEKCAPLARLTALRPQGGGAVGHIEGLEDRTAAEAWRGKKLYLPRTLLPEIKDENTYYHIDLIGLEARHKDGVVLGRVAAVANFGAGDLLDIKPQRGNSFYIPFTESAVPKVDIHGGFVIVDPPPGLLDDKQDRQDA